MVRLTESLSRLNSFAVRTGWLYCDNLGGWVAQFHKIIADFTPLAGEYNIVYILNRTNLLSDNLNAALKLPQFWPFSTTYERVYYSLKSQWHMIFCPELLILQFYMHHSFRWSNYLRSKLEQNHQYTVLEFFLDSALHTAPPLSVISAPAPALAPTPAPAIHCH